MQLGGVEERGRWDWKWRLGGVWVEIVITKGALAGFLPHRPELLALLTLYWLARDGFSRGVGSFRDGSEDLAWSSNLRLGQPMGIKPWSDWSCGSAKLVDLPNRWRERKRLSSVVR